MKQLFTFFAIVLIASSCGKDKFTSAPQITFIDITPNVYKIAPITTAGPLLKIRLTDKEGDFGFAEFEDTSYVYVKNITVPPFDIDSAKFPTNPSIKRADLNAEIVVDLKFLRGIVTKLTPAPRPNYTDTVFYEVYVRDFAGNKSNVIKTSKALFLLP